MEIDSELAGKASYPKPLKTKNGKRQIVRMILKDMEEDYVIRVVLDYGATILLLNKSWANTEKYYLLKELSQR
jgi:hypothetical protein